MTPQISRCNEVPSPWTSPTWYKLPPIDLENVWIARDLATCCFQSRFTWEQVRQPLILYFWHRFRGEISFFNFCLNYSRNPQPYQPEDFSQRNLRQTTTRTVTLPNGGKHEEEIEYIHDYSWRNFFATINYAKIMQKLSKGRPHRIWMLVHYKSSVCLLYEDWFQMKFIHSVRPCSNEYFA